MTRRFYPVTAAEIGAAVTRKRAAHDNCTIAVREDHTLLDGRTFPMQAYGSPEAYEYIQHKGLTYGVPRVDRGWETPILVTPENAS